MRVLVCGGRDYLNYARMCEVLNAYSIDAMCHGAARGADSLAGTYAKYHRVRCEEFPADWERDGKAAGPIRNRVMLESFCPDLVVAFPGGKGTTHMVKLAQKAGVPVKIVDNWMSEPVRQMEMF